jgi:hypothetical protein
MTRPIDTNTIPPSDYDATKAAHVRGAKEYGDDAEKELLALENLILKELPTKFGVIMEAVWLFGSCRFSSGYHFGRTDGAKIHAAQIDDLENQLVDQQDIAEMQGEDQ